MTRDPFVMDGPTLWNISGGLTSGYMLRLGMAAHGGRLPRDHHVVFTNTGRERPETLDFLAEMQSRWGVNLRWLEYRTDAPDGWTEVDRETASRNGEPFADLIESRSYLPNAVTRFCTVALKIKVAAAFMRAEGYDRWTSVVGLRRDEEDRVLKLRARDHGEWDVACPLYDAGVAKSGVNAFWLKQPFRLDLQSWEGNCDLCFLKGRKVRERIMRDHPELVGWWASQESAIGGRFHAHEPGYAETLARVRRLPLLPMDLDAEAMRCTSGACTDRRPRPRHVDPQADAAVAALVYARTGETASEAA